MGKTVRSKKVMRYHSRVGYPVIHRTKTSNRKFIMVRTKRGGTKRLYLKKGRVPKQHRGK